jgi:glycosyltransferase involved in cell wall biosynthesis
MTVRIMQHCFGKAGTGGPVVALERLLASSALSFGQIRQTQAAGGLNVGLVWRFVSEIRRYRPELIHVRGLGNEGFHAALASKLAGVPKILVSIHGTQRDLQTGNRIRGGIVAHVLEPLTLAMATHIATVCDSAATRAFLRPYRRKLVGTVPNGVTIPDLPLVSDSKLRARWGVPENWPLGICVSRITEEKGYLILAQALAHLDATGVRNFAVLVVGGGDKKGQIQRLFSGLNNIKVVFVGHQEVVGKFLVAGDFFLFPSLHENLSNALLEAMAHSLPAIAAAVGGNTEVIQKGGGVLIPAGDAIALADALSTFLADPEAVKRMGEEAREIVRRHYSVARMVDGWERLYRQILGRA